MLINTCLATLSLNSLRTIDFEDFYYSSTVHSQQPAALKFESKPILFINHHLWCLLITFLSKQHSSHNIKTPLLLLLLQLNYHNSFELFIVGCINTFERIKLQYIHLVLLLISNSKFLKKSNIIE